MSNSNWYQTESWYAPLQHGQTAQTQRAQPQNASWNPERQEKRKSHTGLWITLISLILVIAFVAGIGLPIILWRSQKASVQPSGQTQRPSNVLPGWDRKDDEDSEAGKDGGFGYKTDGDDGNQGENADEFPEDWSEFFENFYEQTDTSAAEVNIQQGQLPENFTLQLMPAGDEELSLQKLYEKCAPSIVGISGYTDGQSGYNWGTGIVLSSDGLILTNTHVIDKCDRAVVTLADDSEYEAELIGADTISDLAVLKIDAAGLTPAVFGESARLRVGDPVAAIGNPLGETFRSTLTDGIISAISRDISYKGRVMTLLQTNTALNEGNSGGALFNMQGQVVGITNMKMMSSYSSIEGIGFAIPSSTVLEVVNSIVRYGQVRGRPSIGITVGAIPEDAKNRYDLPEGLYITDVLETSDAWAQGIRPGDILTEVNHIHVKTTSEVTEIKDQYGVGDTLLLTVWRNGETMEFHVLLMDTNDLYGS